MRQSKSGNRIQTIHGIKNENEAALVNSRKELIKDSNQFSPQKVQVMGKIKTQKEEIQIIPKRENCDKNDLRSRECDDNAVCISVSNQSKKEIRLDKSSISGALDQRNATLEEANIVNRPKATQVYYHMTLFYCLLIILCCILFSTPTTLMPLHDVIKFPQYWYEGMISLNLTYPIHWICLFYLDAKKLHKVKSIASLSSCIRMYAMMIFAYDVTYVIIYLIWTNVMNLNWPIPHEIQILGYPIYLFFLTTVWYQFPSNIRKNPEDKKRIRAYIYLYLWFMVMTFQYTPFNKLLESVCPEWQWTLAFILPMIAMGNKNVINKLVTKCAGCDDLYSVTYTSISVGAQHSTYIAITIGSLATKSTSYCLLLTKFLVDLHHCYKIIMMQNKISPGDQKMAQIIEGRDRAVATLAMTEIMEVLIPLIYGINFMIAYYGPNSMVLGNIGNSYWQYNAVEDITNTLSSVSLMFLVDLVSGLFIGFILQALFSINLLKTCGEMVQKFWPLMAIKIATIASRVIYRWIFSLILTYHDLLYQ